jgi:hypothetical protein
MEGWRQRRPGSNAKPPGKKNKTDLTLTGLLMEGVDSLADLLHRQAINTPMNRFRMRQGIITMKGLRVAAWVGSMTLLSVCGCQQSRPNPGATEGNGQTQFRWLDSSRDSQIWNRVQTAFTHELKPDDPAKLKPHQAAYKYKYLHQIGVFREAALVILRHRLIEDDPYDDWFDCYSYDLRSEIKTEIFFEPRNEYWDSDGLYGFSIVKPAQFEQSVTPDVVFTYDGCTECEADHYLASFRYDSSKGWTARQWDNKNSLLLMDDPEPDDNALSSDYLFKIKDWNGDGLDELAVRRRTVTQDARRKQAVDDSTMLYKAENGTLVGHWMLDAKLREAIKAELCSDSSLSFCQSGK